MKITVSILIAASIMALTSCETTKEITINEDGTGIFSTTNDMSGLIGMAKMSGQAKDLDQMSNEQAIDTSFSLDKLADAVEEVTPEEKEMIKKGMLGMNIDVKNDKMIIKLSFPFEDAARIGQLDQLSARVTQSVMKQQMSEAGDKLPAGMSEGSSALIEASIEDYYTTTYSKGLIERKLIAEKYDSIGTDEQMMAMKEISSMGMGNSTLIINLPAPVKKAEGKNLTVSEDKMKVSIAVSTEDFFDDGKSLEFRIEY